MGLDSAFRRDDQTELEPGRNSSWDDWIPASKTFNFCSDDPLIDWLELYGRSHGLVPDNERAGYDERTDFRRFLLDRANEFEAAVCSHIEGRHGVCRVASESGARRSRRAVEATWEAMTSGVSVIAQGVLWNPENRTYGSPDLLVRSDVLRTMFPGDIGEEEALVAASGLPAGCRHYRVVDIKFTTLDLLKDGHAGGDHLKYMVQLWIYNEALGRIQGYTPPASFLLGRRWKASKGRGASAIERLARVDHDRQLKGNEFVDLRGYSLAACDWLRRVRFSGSEWSVLPTPSVAELWPNIRRLDDQPWHRAKQELAHALEDLTILPRVTPDKRRLALARGITRWTDPGCSAAILGITGEKNPAIVDAVIEANRSDPNGPFVFPASVTADQGEWRRRAVPEFYVDFETVSDLDDDFSRFPETNGEPLIFMIGCGHMSGPPESPKWNFRVFTVHSLSVAEEGRVIDDWILYLQRTAEALGGSLESARLFHWSPAETSNLTDAYNAAHVRQGTPAWPALPWYDLLNRVVRAQPITVRGAFGFGLKAVAKAMHSHGLIDTKWSDGPTDGLGAMVGAWWCRRESSRSGRAIADIELMTEIAAYNEVDCRVMADVLQFLRSHH